MIPHLYAMDSQHKSQDLASKILSASSPSAISSACDAIDDFLHKHTVDQKRSFFTIAFPSLICKIFGFDEASSQKSASTANGWIDQIQGLNDSDLELRVFNLLSPYGVLFSSINSVDKHCLVKYVFPVERLPEWVRFMLQSEKDCAVLAELCDLFKGRVKRDPTTGTFQVQLNVFEYFMFWFAYYPVCRGNSESSSAVVVKKSRRFRLENWTSFSVLSGATRGQSGQKMGCGLYIHLLYAYLRAFVPNDGSEVHQPYRSSLLHYSSGYDGSFTLQMEFVVNTMIHFWLVDNDFSPLSVNVCKSLPFRAVLGETPPTSGLGEVLTLFVKYLNSSCIALNHMPKQTELVGNSPRIAMGSLDFTNSMSGVPCNSMLQRPLYRFILRTFLFCPVETYIKNASQVFSLWISYIEPWKTTLEEFAELDSFIDQSMGRSGDGNNHSTESIKDNGQATLKYSPSWEGYVLANYLFYTSLVMHFLGFAHKFLHTDVETIIQMVLKVLSILTSSRDLKDLIKRVDTAFHARPTSSSVMAGSAHKFVPSIRAQLQDWEDGLCEDDADGSFLHEKWNQDLRLLSDGEDGGQHLLQLLILRAESEFHAISGDNVEKNLRNVDLMKSQMEILFGNTAGSPKSVTTPEWKQSPHAKDDLFKPRWIGNQKLGDVRYKGDWMKRPISDGEISWLARLLVRLSDWLNAILGLNHGPSSAHRSSSVSYVDVDTDMCDAGGSKEAIKVGASSVASFVLFLGMAVSKFMREHGYRVNLRVFASKKFVMVLLLAFVFNLLRKVLLRVLGSSPACNSLTC